MQYLILIGSAIVCYLLMRKHIGGARIVVYLTTIVASYVAMAAYIFFGLQYMDPFVTIGIVFHFPIPLSILVLAEFLALKRAEQSVPWKQIRKDTFLASAYLVGGIVLLHIILAPFI